MENYYDILGVSETATTDEIKKAYRKKSKEFHPDVNPNGEEMFKKVAEAYDTLSDDNKKTQYDFQRKNPGAGSFGGGNPFGDGINPWDLFERMTNRGRRRKNAPDKVVNFQINLFDSFLGTNKPLNFSRKVMCDPCKGQGGERTICQHCNGQGMRQQRMGNGMFTQIFSSPCPACGGVGSTLKNACYSCSGSGTRENLESIHVNIPIGIDNGQFLRLQNMGDFSNGDYGDLLLQIHLNDEKGFSKEGDHLIYTATLGLNDLSKDKIDVPHPDGLFTVSIPKEFDTDTPLKVKNKGFRTQNLGDLYVKLRVKFSRTT